MALFDKIVEERIRAAQQEGAFDNLPGRGKPLDLEDDIGVPEDLRLTFRVLKNSNCLPVEMQLRKEFVNLRALLNAALDETTRRELRRELNLVALKLNLKRRSLASLDLPQAGC